MRFERMRYRVTSPHERPRLSSGFTLVELLVVIVLIGTLVATAIPVLAPGGDERRLREASRNLNAYVQGAQTRAIQTGRPFGIALRRLSEETQDGEDNAVVTRVEYVETPPAFAGFDSSSVGRIVSVPSSVNVQSRWIGLQLLRYAAGASPTGGGRVGVPAGYTPGLLPDAFLRPGDTIELGGARYEIRNPDDPLVYDAAFRNLFANVYPADSPFAGYFVPSSGGNNVLLPLLPIDRGEPELRFSHASTFGSGTVDQELNAQLLSNAPIGETYFGTQPLAYKIYRQPVPVADEPFELPAGTAIDLQASIFGNGFRLYDPGLDYNNSADEFVLDTRPIMVLFSPDGGIASASGLQVARPQNSNDPTEPGPVITTLASSSLALLVGRRDLIPGDPTLAGRTADQDGYRNPIDLRTVAPPQLTEIESKEVTDQFNWLNLESRWVVVGAQSGTTATIDNSSPILPAGTQPFWLEQQLGAALDNAPGRVLAGGR